MSSNFKLEDEELTSAGKTIYNELTKSQEIFSHYLTLMEEICSRGFIEGETHKALVAFQTEVRSAFKDKFSEVGIDVELLCKSLINDADRLDENLYN